jgi:hypothetical protein
MDKIYMSVDEMQHLFAWRDENRETVRRYRPLFDECIVKITDHPQGMFIRVAESADGLTTTFACTVGDTVAAKFVYHRLTGRAEMRVDRIAETFPHAEHDDTVNSIMSMYCSAMAYMAAVEPRTYSDASPSPKKAAKASARKPRKKAPSVVYIRDLMRKEYRRVERNPDDPRREYTLPDHPVSCRGHWRRLKSGKTVWVRPHEKYKDKKGEAGTTYRLAIGKENPS